MVWRGPSHLNPIKTQKLLNFSSISFILNGIRARAKMTKKKYVLSARIGTSDPRTVEQTLTLLVGVDGMLTTDEGFRIRTTIEGFSAEELNRMLLIALRLADKEISVSSEWTCGETKEKFINDKRE